MLPHYSNITGMKPLTPIYSALFEVQASLPSEVLESIVAYDLDVNSKKLTLVFNLNEESLSSFQHFSVESIKILHHDKTGRVLIQTELEHIVNPSFMSLKADYSESSLLQGSFTFSFGTIYQSFAQK